MKSRTSLCSSGTSIETETSSITGTVSYSLNGTLDQKVLPVLPTLRSKAIPLTYAFLRVLVLILEVHFSPEIS